jgi:hypothetical protein
MAIILADTNALIYFLKGDAIMAPYKKERFGLSEISEIELLGVKNISLRDKEARTTLVQQCILYPFMSEIKIRAIQLKQQTTLKIPDAIIAATALHFDLILLTADKEFKKIKDLPLILLEF